MSILLVVESRAVCPAASHESEMLGSPEIQAVMSLVNSHLVMRLSRTGHCARAICSG